VRHNGALYINLKCDPIEADFLRQAFESVIPSYHMNKIQWNSVIMGGDVPLDLLTQMIAASYDLTKPKMKKALAVKRKYLNNSCFTLQEALKSLIQSGKPSKIIIQSLKTWNYTEFRNEYLTILLFARVHS